MVASVAGVVEVARNTRRASGWGITEEGVGHSELSLDAPALSTLGWVRSPGRSDAVQGIRGR
jgi:hypothetical protein